MGKVSEKNLRWRRKQPRGAIMSPEEFHRIEEASGSAKRAGAIYWNRVRKHQKGRKEKK